MLAELDHGGAYVRVLGREERDTDLLLRTWRGLRVKGLGDDRPSGSARRVAENAALAESLAATAGARVPTVLGVAATDVASWRKFRRYFRVIGPFSRFIRRSTLRALARNAASPEVTRDGARAA